MDLTGRTLGQIRLDALIGRGGMGAVYRGFDLRLKRPVAVKVLRARSRRASEARGRFIREARLLSQLDHPGVCRVYDLVEHPEMDLLVLELIEGRTLAELIHTEAPGKTPADWSAERQLTLARDVADALAAAHRQLILHRDLKPDNVMVTTDGHVKLLDFGIARPLLEQAAQPEGNVPLTVPGDAEVELTLFAGALGAADGPAVEGEGEEEMAAEATFRTLRGVTVGTVAYMSPEQALGHELTAASDMYAYGILLQEMLTGRRAYPRLSMLELFQRVARAEPEPTEGLDPELEDLLRDLLAKNPAERPSAAEARDRVQWLLDRPARRRRHRRRILTAAGATLLVAAALGAILFSRFESRRQAALAERFARDASAVEWFLRAEHLSPAHDIRPARGRVRRQLEGLAARLPSGRRLGRVAGAYALGRAHLALDDLDEARRHLEAAWEGGYRRPEVASYLGLALVRLHSRERELAERIPDDEARRRRLEQLSRTLGEPGSRWLRTGRFDGTAEGASEGSGEALLSVEPEHYPQALVAFEEDRLDEALAHASTAAKVWPWFYEADLLASQILQRRANRFGLAGEYSQALADLAEAGRLAASAARVGRSDPRVASELCAVEAEILSLQLAHTNIDAAAQQASFERGETACRKALVLDPDGARPLRLLAQLLQRGAEVGATELGEEGDPRPLLEEAAALARRALELAAEDAPSWKALGDIYSMWADWEFFRGLDPSEAIGQMRQAYEQAVRLNGHEGRYVNSVGNAHCFEAELQAKLGGDPLTSFRAAASAFWRAHELGSYGSFSYPLTNLGICLASQVYYELQIGLEATESLAELDRALKLALDANPRSYRSWRELGELRRLQAVRKALRGESAETEIAAALEALERALGFEQELHGETVLVATHVTAAWLEVRSGGDPAASLRAARELAGAVLELEPTWQPTLLRLAQTHRLEAVSALGAGRFGEASRAAAAGRKPLRQALEADPVYAPAFLELGRLALIEAAARRAAGGDPSPSWQRADEAFRRALELWPKRPDAHLGLASLARQRAAVRPEDEARHGADAERHREAATKLRAELADQPAADWWLSTARESGQRLWPI